MKYILITLLLFYNIKSHAYEMIIEDKKGRTIQIELLNVSETSVTCIRIDILKRYIIPFNLLSDSSVDKIKNTQTQTKIVQETKVKTVFNHKELWMTDLKKAEKKARIENKSILLNFTGSDRCGPCINLNKNIFEKLEFKNYAKDKLVIVKLDYPRKNKQSPKIKKQNKIIKEQYKVTGYPTIIIVTPSGKILYKKSGYSKKGVEDYITEIESKI